MRTTGTRLGPVPPETEHRQRTCPRERWRSAGAQRHSERSQHQLVQDERRGRRSSQQHVQHDRPALGNALSHHLLGSNLDGDARDDDCALEVGGTRAKMPSVSKQLISNRDRVLDSQPIVDEAKTVRLEPQPRRAKRSRLYGPETADLLLCVGAVSYTHLTL